MIHIMFFILFWKSSKLFTISWSSQKKRVSKKDKKSIEKRIIDRPLLEPQNSMMMERKETNENIKNRNPASKWQ